MAKSLLVLETLTDHDVVTIDQRDYEVRAPGEMSVIDFFRIAKRAEALEAALKTETLSEDALEQLRKTLDDLSRSIFVDVPDDVWKRLTDRNKLDILSAFSTRHEVTTKAQTTLPETESPTTGVS